MPVASRSAFKNAGAERWTAERIARLSAAEIKQLRENAERLNETALAELCAEVLAGKPRVRGRPRSAG
jgi:hypothetical protein